MQQHTHTHMNGMLQLAGSLAPHARTKWRTFNKLQELFLLLFSGRPSPNIFGEPRLRVHLPLNKVHTLHLQGKTKIKQFVYAKHVYEIYLIILLPCSQISQKRQALQGIQR